MRAGSVADTAGEPGKHLAIHKVAIGQDFEQSGKVGFWSGQHGMLSDMEAISDMAVIDASSITAAPHGIAIGTVRRPTTDRIESRRGMSDQICTHSS
jgi:hypothetical protein